MHPALALPEIVELIIQVGRGPKYGNTSADRLLLKNCLTINKTFFSETCRILWHTVGETIGTSPAISTLARLARENPKRAQVYANFIHFLRFAYEQRKDDTGESMRLIEAIRWHPDLLKLEYPKLRHLLFYGQLKENDPGYNWDITLAALHYAKPSVANFDVSVSDGFSNIFLDTLAASCPKLTNLTLRSRGRNTVTEDGLSRFLEHVPHLRFVHVKEVFQNSWTSQSLSLFAKLQKLKVVYTGTIPDSCFSSLSNVDGHTFPELQIFHGGLSEFALECLAPFAPNLTEIYLENPNLPPSEHILASASGFTNLMRLVIDFTKGSVIDGNDLSLLARSCKNLDYLCISDLDRRIRGAAPRAVNLDDDTILELSGSFEKLRGLTLVINQPDLLTYKSVKYLASNCALLDSLLLSCDFNWKEAVDSAKKMRSDLKVQAWSTTISDLHLVLPQRTDYLDDNDELIVDPVFVRSTNETAKGMVELLPELKTIEILYGNMADYEFVDRIQRMVDPVDSDWEVEEDFQDEVEGAETDEESATILASE